VTDLPDDVRPDAAETLDSAGDGPTPGEGAGTGSRRPGRRAGLVGAAVLAVGLIGGAVAYGVAQLSGGGAQPDAMVPSSALAIVSVDLDPSAGQKIDALRFARAFPELKARMGGGEDLRKILFDAMSDSAGVAGSWQDVEPWLGDRAALAVLPAADELDEPVPVVVLAVTDEGKARAGLPKAVPSASCQVASSFAVCAQDAATVERAMSDATKKSLADDSTYARDLGSIGNHGIVAAWVDLGRVSAAAPDLLIGLRGVGSSLAGAGEQLKGRYVAAARFDGPHLELAGRVEGAGLPRLGGSTDVGTLPKDTLVALGIGDADKVVGSAWQRVREAASAMGGEQAFDDQVSMLPSTYGITLPDDLTAAVGDRLTVAVGAGSTPHVAVRVTGSADSVDRLRGAVERASGSALQVATATSGGTTVLATDQAYATAVAQGRGLDETDGFGDAVPDADRAQGVLYLDIAGLVSAYGPQLGIDASTLQQIRPLSALGITVHQDGDALDYRLRLVTR
jgi:hypothetical protein